MRLLRSGSRYLGCHFPCLERVAQDTTPMTGIDFDDRAQAGA